MSDILLDYAFTVNTITPLPSANAAYIRQVLAIVKPLNSGVPAVIVKCTTKSQVAAVTANQDVAELFNAGLNSVFVLPSDDLDVTEIIEAAQKDFFTILISSDFSTAELSDFGKGTFKGVIGYSFSDETAAKNFATVEKQCGFLSLTEVTASNMFFAFGKLLSSTSWKNQQYIQMPKDDGINDLGVAKGLFNERISFVLTSGDYGTRLAFFVAGKQAITAPYIYENLKLDAQSAAVSYIMLNEPDYTITEASLVENAVQGALDKKYVNTGLVTSASVSIELINDNFRATGTIAVPPPKALWGVDVDLIQGEI